MFQFSGFAPTHYEFMCRSARKQGFPHSEIFGSKLIRSSPKLIAAYHVLHRLSVPRHSPNALKSLDHSHYCCSSPTQYIERGPVINLLNNFVVARFLDRSRPKSFWKNLMDLNLHSNPLCSVSLGLNPNLTVQRQRPRGPIQTKHFIHDVKQQPFRKSRKELVIRSSCQPL